MSNKDKFYLIIIGVLSIMLLMSKCGSNLRNPFHKEQNNIIVNTSDTSYATIVNTVTTYVPKWKTRIIRDTIHDSIPHLTRIDTSNIIEDYFSTYTHNDSVISDTINLYINDSITQNKIKSRKIIYSINFPTITNNITKTVIQNKNEFYYGVGLVGSKTGIQNFGPELLLRTKNKNIYGVGVGIDGNLNPNLSLRAYWKFFK